MERHHHGTALDALEPCLRRAALDHLLLHRVSSALKPQVLVRQSKEEEAKQSSFDGCSTGDECATTVRTVQVLLHSRRITS